MVASTSGFGNELDLSSCHQVERLNIQIKWTALKGLSQHQQVDDLLTDLNTEIERLCNKPKQVGETISNLVTPYLRRGWESQIQIELNNARRISEFRAPSREMDQIDILSARLGKTRSDYISSEEEAEIMVGGLSNGQQRAESCTSIDLRETQPLLRRVRDQGARGWCFAFSMSDLYTHHYRKENPDLSEEAFSPIAFSIDYYFNDWLASWASRVIGREKGTDGNSLNHYDGGLPFLAASRNITGDGLCLESAVRAPSNLAEHIENIEKIVRMREEAFGDREISADESQTLTNRIKTCSGISNSLTAMFPQMSWENLSQVLLDTESETFMRDLSNFSCQGNRRRLRGMTNFRFNTVETSARSGVAAINRVLESGDPIDFNYDANILSTGTDVSKEELESRPPGSHSSLIIGRRFNQGTGTCQYLVRNSWGVKRGSYHRSIQTDGHDGFYWLSEEDVHKTFQAVNWIE